MLRGIATGAMLFTLFLTGGCSAFLSSAGHDLAGNLHAAMVNHDDLETVAEASPAYLLMIESLLIDRPNDEFLLRAAADLYSAYAGVFVSDRLRAAKLTDKALMFGFRAACIRNRAGCSLRDLKFQEFQGIVQETIRDDVPTFFTLGAVWAGWIEAHREDWNAIAEIPRVEAIMRRIVFLHEGYRDGEAHLYLGSLATLIPAALGGKPETGKKHFERALELSGGKNLMVKVLYARQYARLTFDRELHDRLLGEVLEADPRAPGYVLINTLAQKQARQLLDSADQYF